MAKKRSAEAQLIDNLQRKIRHLRKKEIKAQQDGNYIDEVGFKRNQVYIEKMIDDIRRDKRLGKLDNSKLLEYAEKAKNNPNYSNDTKKIRKITFKLIGNEPLAVFGELMDDPDISEIFAKFSTISGKYIGQSGNPGARAVANAIEDSIDTMFKTRTNDFTDKQIALLIKMSRRIEKALDGRGVDGVVFPLNA